MNYVPLALAFLGSTLAFFVVGTILFAALPAMKTEFGKFPNVYRQNDAMMKAMPLNMVSILISILVTTVLYAKMYPAGGNIISGLTFGALIALFAVCIYAVHNYAILNISITLSLYESACYFIQWLSVGAALGLIYKPS